MENAYPAWPQGLDLNGIARISCRLRGALHALAVAGALLLASQAGATAGQVEPETGSVTSSAVWDLSWGLYTAGVVNTAPLDNSRPLRSGDLIVVRIVEDRGGADSFRVTDSGDILAPYIGLVKAAGLTPRALAFQMKAGLEKKHFEKATVIVALEAARGKSNARGSRSRFITCGMDYITIHGSVVRPGKYEYAPEETLKTSQAIQNAGGFAPNAKDTQQVKVIRRVPGKGTVTLFVNLRDGSSTGVLENDITILSNDLLIVD